MSEGETILGAIRQLRELHRNVSLLLKTADSAMTEKGWVNAKSDATALHEMSYSINSPDQWMPWEVFRYYKHKDHPTLLASTAVLLDDFEGRIPEPLVTAALFAFGPGQDFSKFYNWFACIFKAVPAREAHGAFFDISRPQLPQDWQSDFTHAWCFALPLVNINSENDLRQRIAQPLTSKADQVSAIAS